MSIWRWWPALEEYSTEASGVRAVVRWYGAGRGWGYSVTTASRTVASEGHETADSAMTAADKTIEAHNVNTAQTK